MADGHQCKDVVLNIEVSATDGLYRISRPNGESNQVVYVTVEGDGVIPECERTEGSLIIKNLQKLESWRDKTWRTLKVYEDGGDLKCEHDTVLPHALMNKDLLDDLPLYNIFCLEVISRPKHRTSRVTYNGKEYYMKTAPFSYQLGFLTREIETYRFLARLCSSLTPKLAGYVYEETPRRVIGFLCEVIEGWHPNTEDIPLCKEALQRLHNLGVLHGDLNRYNILVTPTRNVQFIDLECSLIAENSNQPDYFPTKMKEEVESLHQGLSDQTDLGKPFTSCAKPQ